MSKLTGPEQKVMDYMEAAGSQAGFTRDKIANDLAWAEDSQKHAVTQEAVRSLLQRGLLKLGGKYSMIQLPRE